MSQQTARLPISALQRIADSLPLGIAVVGEPDFTYRYVNQAFRRFAPGKEFLGRTVREVWPENADQLIQLFERVVAQGQPVQEVDVCFEIRRSPDATLESAHFSFRYCPFPIGNGETGVLIEAVETTERVMAMGRARDESKQEPHAADVLTEAFERMGDGFFALDTEWRFTYMNGQAEQLLKKKRDELMGVSIWEAMPEAVDSVFHKKFMQAVQKQEPIRFEEYYPPTDMWASVYVQPAATGLNVYLSNITSQKQAEMALATSEGQLRAVIDNSPAVIYMKDLDGHFLRANGEFLRRYQVSQEWLVGKTDFDLLPKQVADVLRSNDSVVADSGEAREFEEEVELPSGRRVLYLSTKFPLKDSSARIYGIAGISTDMNERIRQERALAVSEQRFRKIFEEGPLGIALLDPALHFQQVNDRFAEMLGRSKEELAGLDITSVTHPDDIERSVAPARLLLQDDIPYYRLEKRYVRPDGSFIWASVHGSAIRDDADRPMFILALAEDISRKKAAEIVLRDRDLAIRQAYTDVIAAVTGGKLVLMTPEEIDEILGRPVSEMWRLDEYANLADVRHRLAAALAGQGFEQDQLDSYVLAACEGFTNAIKHGGGGEVRVHREDDRVQVAIVDHGKGIDFQHLPKATLVAGFSTAQSLGMGFTIMLEVCYRLLLSTQEGLTILVLEAVQDN